MLTETVTGLVLLWRRPVGISDLQCMLGLSLLGVIWSSTFLVQIPCHESLAKGFDAVVHRRLVTTNWSRTVAWSLRAVLVVWMACSIAH